MRCDGTHSYDIPEIRMMMQVQNPRRADGKSLRGIATIPLVRDTEFIVFGTPAPTATIFAETNNAG